MMPNEFPVHSAGVPGDEIGFRGAPPADQKAAASRPGIRCGQYAPKTLSIEPYRAAA